MEHFLCKVYKILSWIKQTLINKNPAKTILFELNKNIQQTIVYNKDCDLQSVISLTSSFILFSLFFFLSFPITFKGRISDKLWPYP